MLAPFGKAVGIIQTSVASMCLIALGFITAFCAKTANSRLKGLQTRLPLPRLIGGFPHLADGFVIARKRHNSPLIPAGYLTIVMYVEVEDPFGTPFDTVKLLVTVKSNEYVPTCVRPSFPS